MPDTYRALDRTEASLGRQVSTHSRLPRVGPLPVLLCALASALLWWKASSHPRLALAAWLMTALAVAAGVGFAIDLARRRLWSAVSVFEHGLLLHRATGARALPWAEIESIELRRERRLRPGTNNLLLPGLIVLSAETEWQWVYRVRAEGRVIVELSDQFAESSALLDTLRRETASVAVPRLFEELRGGGRISIGPLALTEAHLEVRGAILPWAEIADVSIDGASLRVRDYDDVERASVPVEQVPNAHVVVAVAEELALEHRA